MNKAALLVVLAAATASAAPKKKPPAKKPTPTKPDGKPPLGDPSEDASAPTPAPVDEGPPKPWAVGVAKDLQNKATDLYEEGNSLFAMQAHAPALEKYKQAIALWDHPLIRFNMAVTEIRLDRILDAADDLEKALRFGEEPFKLKSDTLYQQALDFQSLVKGRVGYIEASSDQVGTHVFLDGKPWFDAPGKKKLRVLAGEHAVSGEKPRFLTSTQKIVVNGGATAEADVKLVPLDTAVHVQYRFSRWIPWTMAGVGVAVGLGGLGTLFLGNSAMNQFNADFAQQCPNGCEPGLTDPQHRSLGAEKKSAQLEQKVGVVVMGVGGGITLTGLILVFANTAHRVLPNVEVAPKAGGAVAAYTLNF